MFSSYRMALAALMILIATLYLLGTIFAASAHNPTPHMTHAEHRQLTRLMRQQERRFGVPAGCAVVGVWEDGTIAAYCVPESGLETWQTHGPDSADTWHAYTGTPMRSWLKRAARLDGRVG
jgi:hypothetical protein